MWIKASKFVVRLGGNTYVNCQTLIRYKDTPLFNLRRTDTGYLGIDFEIFGKDGGKIATVKRNEIYVADDVKSKIAFKGSADRVTLVEKGMFFDSWLVDIRKRSEASPAELDVSLRTYLPDGRRLDLTPVSTNLGGFAMINCVVENCGVGLQID